MTGGTKSIFAEVAPTYELVNHVLTFGLDIMWRRKAARLAARGGGRRWLDVCSRAGYTYLASTTPRFYDARTLAALLLEAGFEPVSFRQSFFGVAAIHSAVKPF